MSTRIQQLIAELKQEVGDGRGYEELRAAENHAIATNIPAGWSECRYNGISDGTVEISVGGQFTVFFYGTDKSITARMDLPLAAVRCAIARGDRS
jgi:hypothetical protein